MRELSPCPPERVEDPPAEVADQGLVRHADVEPLVLREVPGELWVDNAVVAHARHVIKVHHDAKLVQHLHHGGGAILPLWRRAAFMTGSSEDFWLAQVGAILPFWRRAAFMTEWSEDLWFVQVGAILPF